MTDTLSDPHSSHHLAGHSIHPLAACDTWLAPDSDTVIVTACYQPRPRSAHCSLTAHLISPVSAAHCAPALAPAPAWPRCLAWETEADWGQGGHCCHPEAAAVTAAAKRGETAAQSGWQLLWGWQLSGRGARVRHTVASTSHSHLIIILIRSSHPWSSHHSRLSVHPDHSDSDRHMLSDMTWVSPVPSEVTHSTSSTVLTLNCQV